MYVRVLPFQPLGQPLLGRPNDCGPSWPLHVPAAWPPRPSSSNRMRRNEAGRCSLSIPVARAPHSRRAVTAAGKKEALPNRPLLERDLSRRCAAFVCLEQSQRLPPVRMPTPGCFRAQLAILALDGPCGLAASAAALSVVSHVSPVYCRRRSETCRGVVRVLRVSTGKVPG